MLYTLCSIILKWDTKPTASDLVPKQQWEKDLGSYFKKKSKYYGIVIQVSYRPHVLEDIDKLGS